MMVPRNLHLQLLGDVDEDYTPMKKQAPVPEKKRKIHKTSEQKGRQRINAQINILKNMLPECASVVTTKAYILERAVDTLRRLEMAVDQMENFNKKIAKENHKMSLECEKQRKMNGFNTNPFTCPNTIVSDRTSGINSLRESQEDLSLLSNVKTEPSFDFFMGGLEDFCMETPVDVAQMNENNNRFQLISSQDSIGNLSQSTCNSDSYPFGNFADDNNSFSKFSFGLEFPSEGSFGNFFGTPPDSSKRQRMM